MTLIFLGFVWGLAAGFLFTLGLIGHRERRTESSTFTPEEKQHFDAAFRKMDEAFEEADKLFKLSRFK